MVGDIASATTVKVSCGLIAERAARHRNAHVLAPILALLAIGVAFDSADATASVYASAYASTPSNDRCQVQYSYGTGGQTVCPGGYDFTHSVTMPPLQTSAAALVQGGNFIGNIDAGGVVNIATGSLKAYAIQQLSSYIQGGAGENFEDTLHFTIAGASPSTVTALEFAVDVGGVLATSEGGRAGAGFQFIASGGVSNGGIVAQFNQGLGQATTLNENDGNTVFSTKNAGGFDAIVTVDVLGSTADIDISSQLGCDVGFGGSCDFGNTTNGASFGFVSQHGVTFTADSLVFPSNNSGSAAVPEPASWALMLCGFGAIGGSLRTRRRVIVSSI